MIRSLLRGWLLAGLLFVTGAGSAGAAPAANHPARPLIVFLSDFGTIDDAVAICKGVMLSIAPGAEIIDLTHQVTPYSISEGARMLLRTSQYYPKGTVFITVIDPGVGTSRRSVVVKSGRGQYFVLPDNGLVAPVIERDGLGAAREIENKDWLIGGKLSSTFHGRDVYSPVAAHIARGDDWNLVGKPVAALTKLEVPRAVAGDQGIDGRVVALDGPYGNLVTNVSAEQFRGLGFAPGDRVRARIGAEEITVPFVATFGDVPVGAPLAFVDSRGLLSFAINQGNFAKAHGVSPPVDLHVWPR